MAACRRAEFEVGDLEGVCVKADLAACAYPFDWKMDAFQVDGFVKNSVVKIYVWEARFACSGPRQQLSDVRHASNAGTLS